MGAYGEKVVDYLQERNGVMYEVNQKKPFTGKFLTPYQNGQKKTEANYKNGKYDGLMIGWYENGQKKTEVNFINGVKQTTQSIDQIINNEIKRISDKTPIVLNRDLTMLSADYRNGVVYFFYQFTFSVGAYDEDKMKLLTKNYFCSDPSTKVFRGVANNIIINWKYVDLNGIVILDYSMKGANCKHHKKLLKKERQKQISVLYSPSLVLVRN